jgi:hypothetical protein
MNAVFMGAHALASPEMLCWSMDHTVFPGCFGGLRASRFRRGLQPETTFHHPFPDASSSSLYREQHHPASLQYHEKAMLRTRFKEKCLVVVIAFTKSNRRRDARSYGRHNMADPSRRGTYGSDETTTTNTSTTRLTPFVRLAPTANRKKPGKTQVNERQKVVVCVQ